MRYRVSQSRKVSPPGRSHNMNTLHRYQTMPKKKKSSAPYNRNLSIHYTLRNLTSRRHRLPMHSINQPQPTSASESKRETPNYFLPAWSTSASKPTNEHAHTNLQRQDRNSGHYREEAENLFNSKQFLLTIGKHESSKRRE